MATIVTFTSKGSAVTYAEIDANFDNLNAETTAHISDSVDAHDASAISNVASGNLIATTVQAALNELDTEKAPKDSPVLTGVPLAPTAAAGTNTTQIATTAFVIVNGVPAGGIIMYHGAIINIPSGFNLCDGTNGTPDLRDRFIVGAGSTYAPGATGGSANAVVVDHTHGITDPGHNHTAAQVVANGRPDGSGAAQTLNSSVTSTKTTGITINSAGVSGTNANLPPYYALALIMKL